MLRRMFGPEKEDWENYTVKILIVIDKIVNDDLDMEGKSHNLFF